MPTTAQNNEERLIRVEALSRVEGEGRLHLKVANGKVEESRLEIFEPPRLYEAFLRGKDFREVPDITARICGICPVAYQMSSCHALEKALGVDQLVNDDIRRMRNLLYCGEWIESHILHIFMLHLPDFLGYESSISMAADHPDAVKRALAIKKVGNSIVEILGGRPIHPVGVCVGGFYSFPESHKWAELLPKLKASLEDMCELTMFLAEKVEYPDFEQDYEFISLQPDNEYPMNLGPIASSKGVKVSQEEYLDLIAEVQVPHSNALQAKVRKRGNYLVGPLARLNLNPDKLYPRAAEILPKVCNALGKQLPWQNNFLSMPARAIETIHALELAIDILENHMPKPPSRVPIQPRAGKGGHGTEAPRGLLWHRYEVDDAGLILSARIIPPTSQNQPQIEEDLRKIAQQNLALDDEKLTLVCEHAIRNYDPCISCATHFLKLDVERLP